ncbi:doublecortin domain-containing protein 2C [Crotalus adamanteus]|uniref:Doublecortin domain-containing protein 2C n=1 Tax=Crotalus adamanteus TaxID=8729 RepID=A0AAW1C9T8_CROAD
MVGTAQPRPTYSLTDSTPARTIWVYRNGDPFYLGRKFIISPRYVPTFEAFMIQLNEGVPTPFGVRKLYTPSQGHIITDLPELQQGGRYVVAGREKFRKLNYSDIGTKKPQRKKRDEVIRPVVHSNIKVPSKWQSIYNKPRNINVFTNGDILIPPMKILIPRFTLNNWNGVLTLVNEKVVPRCGGIHRLFTLNGSRKYSSEFFEFTRNSRKAPFETGHSVYIAHKSPTEIEGAREIQEDKDVKVEIPIDQVPAEIIQDEEIYADPGSFKVQAPAEIVQDETIDAKNIEEQAKEGEQLQEKKGPFKRMFGFFFSRSRRKDIKGNEEEQDRKKEMKDYPLENEYWDAYGYD